VTPRVTRVQRRSYSFPKMSSIVAQLTLLATLPSGERCPVRVWVGTPVQEPTGEWSCPAGLDGLHDDLCAMRGEDAFQAICLALGLSAALLRGHVAAGGQLRYPGGGDFPLEAYFGWLGSPAPAS
jgi:hypothetical protein